MAVGILAPLGIVVLIGVMIAGAAVIVVGVLRSTGVIGAKAPAGSSDPASLARTRWRWAGIGLGVILAAATIAGGDLGRGPLLAAVTFGLGVLAGVLAGEVLVRPHHENHRVASARPRSIRQYLPPVLTRAVAAATVILVDLMAVTTAAGSPDDQNRPGRSLTYETPDRLQGASAGPWPGSYYTVPALVALLVAGILTAVVLATIARRAAATDLTVDTAARRRSAEAVIAAWGVAVGIPLVGFSITAMGSLLRMSLAPPSWRLAGWSGLILAIGGLVLVCWCLVTLIVPTRATARLVVHA